jgi:hypothetical protein
MYDSDAFDTDAFSEDAFDFGGGDVPGQEGEMAAAAPNARMSGHTTRMNLGLRIIVFFLLGAL